MKRNAFTLAEVLITLGIIGVVAAMTIPTLIGKYQKHVLYNQFLKAVSVIENVVKMYEVDKGCEGHAAGCMDPSNRMSANELMPYFNIAQEINENNYIDICGEDYTQNGENLCILDTTLADPHAFITNDGMLFNMSLDYGSGAGLIVDVNGPKKKPNQFGRDIFVYYLPNEYSNNVVWCGNEAPAWPGFDNVNCVVGDPFECGCAGKLLRERKMNY